jgi:hypothetical protein
MSEIINLRRARKQREKADDQQQAAQNRLSHGRAKGEKQQTAMLEHQAKAKLDQHRLIPPELMPESI